MKKETVSKKVVRESLEYTCKIMLEINRFEEKWRKEIIQRVDEGSLTETGSERSYREALEALNKDLAGACANLGRDITNCPAAIAALAQLKDE